MRAQNLTLLTDLYELTMMQGYYENPSDQIVVFDAFYRKNPCGGAYAVCAGLEQVIEYVRDLHFSPDDIDYLRSLHIFNDDFLEYLRGFHFTGDIYAIPEGTVVFPREPLLKVVAPIMEAQLVETAILNMINHQSLIATKASRVVYAAKGDGIMEFGLRRAQGPDAGIYGARAAMIGGCIGTSNVLTGQMFDVPVKGTHAHSWIMSFPDEYTAFKTYAKMYPEACILLVDTYDVLESGVPNAIRVFKEMRAEGLPMKGYGIRIDSGDLAYLSKKAYQMLEAEGFGDAIISASSDLDEYLIDSLKTQGAKINSWGVGTNLITSGDWPAFGGVYKLAAAKDKEDAEFTPKIKLSENSEKVTNPGNKTIFRIYDKESPSSFPKRRNNNNLQNRFFISPHTNSIASFHPQFISTGCQVLISCKIQRRRYTPLFIIIIQPIRIFSTIRSGIIKCREIYDKRILKIFQLDFICINQRTV